MSVVGNTKPLLLFYIIRIANYKINYRFYLLCISRLYYISMKIAAVEYSEGWNWYLKSRKPARQIDHPAREIRTTQMENTFLRNYDGEGENGMAWW